MRIILTGNEGFIGKNLEKELLQFDYEVVGFERGSTITEIKNQMTRDSIVVHQGAITDTLYEDNIEMMNNNYEFSCRLFDAAFDKGLKVVYASSAASYGIEDCPANIYGWSKYCAEQYGIALFAGTNNFIALRYFNVYGPGEQHKGRMASIAHQAMKKGSMNLFVGNPRRDFVYVKDVVNANMYAINCEGIPTGYYDVGSGVASSFEEVCNHLEIPFEYADESKIPAGYQFFTCSSSDKWMPGWKPECDLESALKEYRTAFNEDLG